MSERKIFNFTSKILVDETIQKYGYDPAIFGNHSAKFVVATCRVCGQPHDVRKGFFNKSGSACHRECKIKEMNAQKSPFSDPAIREKVKQIIKEKYGSEYASQNKEIANKISQTKLTQESQDKSKNTCLERYGVENPFQNEEIKEKMRETWLEKYGVDHPLKSEIVKNKAKETCLERYNVENPMQDSFINKKSQESFPRHQKQNEIRDIIAGLGLKTILDCRDIIPPTELDIYVPEKKFAIEFNGSYWHSEAILDAKDARNKHISKLKKCKEKGIRLFQIFENNWDLRKEQIVNFIKTILGKNSVNIGARECFISNDECFDFIEKNHIQGYGAGTIKYFNLVHGGQVIASMTASGHHRQNVEGNPVVLNRLCFKDGYNVQGGSSKLFKAFIFWAKNEKYDKIISWSDNSWTSGRIYEVLKFKLEIEYGPDYFYWDMLNNKYVSKQSQKKRSTGCPKEITERQFCMEKGLYRIYDAGKKKWEYKL